MRFVTFFGLMVVAKSIRADSLSDIAAFLTTICVVALIIDAIELLKKLSK